MRIKFLLALSIILFLSFNAYSKILQLDDCVMTKPEERDMLRDRIVKIDLKNKIVTFRGYAAYTNQLQIKDELKVYQHDILFTAIDNKLVQFKLVEDEKEGSLSKNVYTADFDKNILQILSTYNLSSGSTSELIIFTCVKSNYDQMINSGKKETTQNQSHY